MSLPSNTFASLSTSFFAPRDAGGAIVGVTNLNGLIGILAVTGDTSIGVSTPGLGAIQVSTAGLPQVPSSVTATGPIVGATVTATGNMGCAGMAVSGGLTAGSATIGNILPSQQVLTPYATTPGSAFYFTQVGGLGYVNGYAVSNASGVILVGLPTGRTGTGVGGSCTAAGNNLAGQSSIYGAAFLPGSATPPGPNEVAFGTIDRTTGSTQSGITASVCGVFVMSN
jgi:hypothetical protein